MISDALETSEVESHEATIDSTTFVLVDTPGFDDTEMSDYQILHAIAAWLEKSCEKGQRLSGLVYLHRINNTRMAGSAVRALHLFQRICGEENYKNVILATTFWNKIEHCKDEGIDRERRLLENEGFWKVMKEKGAQTVRLARNYRDILPALVDMAEKPKVTLDLQQELRDGLKLEQTMAGLFINSDSEQLQEEHEAKTIKMQREFTKEVEKRQNELNARRNMQRQLRLKEQDELKKMEKQQQLMKTQLELYRLNQRVKQAELRARLREEEEMQARAREQEEQILRQRRERQEKDSRQRARLSLSQRKVVNQQLDLLRAANAGGLAQIYVAAIEREGVGMMNEDCSRTTVKRSGLNQWCDFCLKPFGVSRRYRECCPVSSSKRWK